MGTLRAVGKGVSEFWWGMDGYVRLLLLPVGGFSGFYYLATSYQ